MDKKTFRKICIERVKSNKSVNTYKLDKDLNNMLYKFIKKQKAKNIMLYIPLKIELNISALILKLRREKKMLLVPFMEGESFSLVKYRLPLSKKQFGVKEPKNTNKYKHKIDLAIVPIIGTDKTLRRVGFGKGFYDRFFEKNHKKIHKILFVGREYCVSSKIITDDHDVKGSKYLSHRNCHKKKYLTRKLKI
jgi:5-formyltetrahydrofolate cyclo-ligase